MEESVKDWANADTGLLPGNGGSEWEDQSTYAFRGGDALNLDPKFSITDYRLLMGNSLFEDRIAEANSPAFSTQKPSGTGYELFASAHGDTHSGGDTSTVTSNAYNASGSNSPQSTATREFSFVPTGLEFQSLYGYRLSNMSGAPAPHNTGSELPPSPALQDSTSQHAKMWAKVEKLKEVFFKGLEEYKACAEPLDALIPGLGDTDSSEAAIKLSAAVIQAMDLYCYQSGMDAKLERQKFHELFQNLKRDNNKELRFKIFKGEITIAQLVAMDAKELAPEALKRKRETESEKYFQQQVILKQDPKASVIRKTHKGLETVGGDEETLIAKSSENKKSTASTPPSELEEMKVSEEDSAASQPHFLTTNAVPWQDEMINLLEAQNEATPNELSEAEASAEPPGKKLRVGDYHHPMPTMSPPETLAAEASSPSVFIEKSPSTKSPAAFTQLVFRPWESLAWNHQELFHKLRMTESPSDPADGSLHQEVTRLEERLTWLRLQSERRIDRYWREDPAPQTKPRELNKALIQIHHLSTSLHSHAQKISDTMGVPLDIPNLVLPAGVMMTPAPTPFHL
eukprot:Gregarina_sp_Poly_1__5725@NODE_300_length_9800_cov_150_504469_g259_i0_p2_GENE_NODE_300_length_9800_cov_150_504469_g259_i0NODE_300_length_9800_cov_150_504469_g259_i0_p2_ORF_typecomplete_len570_score103_38TFIIS_M/PF07500_14/2e14DUF5411/PF17424_2/0_31_NODE_300_length_9800_cov_150_504469_g259_i080289737